MSPVESNDAPNTQAGGSGRQARTLRRVIWAVAAMLGVSLAVNLLLAYKVRTLSDSLAELTAPPPAVGVGTAVPPIKAHGLDGRTYVISYADGDRPVILYVFTPQCPWCARNLANLKTLLAHERGKYRFVGLSLTDKDVRDYAAQNQLDLPIYCNPSDEATREYKLGSTPQTIVISRDGKVLKNWLGAYAGSQQAEVDDLCAQVAALTGASHEAVRTVIISRDLGGGYYAEFPNASAPNHVLKSDVVALLSTARTDISPIQPARSEEDLKAKMLAALDDAMELVQAEGEKIYAGILKQLQDNFSSVDTEKALKRSMIAPRYGQLTDAVGEMIAVVSKPSASNSQEARDLAAANLPPFVYYSNYGNLDSEIYLPHVIENLARTDLGAREEAKARTLKVLFEFVRLQPKEILELGKDILPSTPKPTDEKIKEIAEKKKERTVLLQSASTSLTTKFREWWRQGDYIFEFQADGDHFRIWVSDSVRPEKIELEGRSTGLQWFLSFYLIFLVESGLSHQNAILLLDEPGLSLHPLAQKDLSKFFDNLSKTNQIVYTTHSPFMVDPDHLDRVKAVYVDDRGNTVTSQNLRAREVDTAEGRSIYAVYAALGLSVSDTLFLGCRAVIVEGQSDQIYLSVIKIYLIGKGLIQPQRELLFPPAGGTRGVKPLVSILGATDDNLPFVTLDSDEQGRLMASQLKAGLYKSAADRVLLIGDLLNMADAEVEDLFPQEFISKVVTRYLQRRAAIQDEDFRDVVEAGKPIVPQIEAYATKNRVPLPESWKVDIAKLAKESLLKSPGQIDDKGPNIAAWKELFLTFEK